MGGCPNGAVPNSLGRGTQQLLDIGSLVGTVATLIRAHNPTAYAAFAASLVDIDSLCALNPDPPEPLNELDFVGALNYIALPEFATDALLTKYIFEWLRYQAFTQFCVCNTVVPDPTQNCMHATNITIPSGQNQIVPLPTVHIEDAVYATYPVFNGTDMNIFLSARRTSSSGAAGASNWFVQFQGSDGIWADMVRGDGFGEGTAREFQTTVQNGTVRVPQTVPMRIRTNFGAAGVYAQLDLCFLPFDPVQKPLPTQPDLPGLPVVPPPLCSTDDLCSIVQELARQLTRVSGQVADIQATVGGTDTMTEIASQAITGEGQIDLVVGTRAVSIELTHLGPGVFTSALGRPRGLMRAGSIRWGDGTGYSKRQFIDAEDFTRLRPQGALSLSWQLINECAGTLRFLR